MQAKQKRWRSHGPGFARYIAMMAALRRPITIRQLAKKDIATETAVTRFVRCAHKAGWVHIHNWLIEPRSVPVELWKFGRGTDAAYPTVRPDGKPVLSKQPQVAAPRIGIEQLSFFALLDEIERGTATPTDVADAVGINHNTAWLALHGLVDANLARIVSWPNRFKPGGRPEPNFTLGGGPSATRPKPLSRTEINRRYSAKRSARRTTNLLNAAFNIAPPAERAAA